MEPNDTASDYSKQDERLGLLIWYRLSRVYGHNVRETQQHLKKWDLSVAQFDVIAQIGEQGKLTQQQLADKLFVTKGNITQLLVKLEEQGLITREQQWKIKLVSLTDKGKALYAEVVPKQERFQVSQFDALTRDEKKQLVRLLRKIQK